MNHSQIINKLIELECFKEGNFLLKSGKESKYYIDLRILVSYPEILKDLSMMLYEKLGLERGKFFEIALESLKQIHEELDL